MQRTFTVRVIDATGRMLSKADDVTYFELTDVVASYFRQHRGGSVVITDNGKAR